MVPVFGRSHGYLGALDGGGSRLLLIFRCKDRLANGDGPNNIHYTFIASGMQIGVNVEERQYRTRLRRNNRRPRR